MKAAEIARLVLDIREVKPGKYEGPCPLHGGKSGRSFVMEQQKGLVTMLCRGGCATQDVLRTMGLNFSDLFDGAPKPMDPATALRLRAEKGLRNWRQTALTLVCELLRRLDQHSARAAGLLDRLRRQGVSEAELEPLWDTLQFAYFNITQIEHDFERLNTKSRVAHLEVWQERRKVANAA